MNKLLAASQPRDPEDHMSVKLADWISVTAKEISMQMPRMTVRIPIGFSFDLADLVLLRGWADFHDLRLAIELDVCADGDEYEEFLALYERRRTFRRWMIWRSCDGVVVQPSMGRTMLFDSMAEALDALIPVRD